MFNPIKSVYVWLEKTFFNTLTRKLVGNFLFLTLIFSASIFIIHEYHQNINALVTAKGDPSLIADVRRVSDISMRRIVALYIFGGVIFFCLIYTVEDRTPRL